MPDPACEECARLWRECQSAKAESVRLDAVVVLDLFTDAPPVLSRFVLLEGVGSAGERHEDEDEDQADHDQPDEPDSGLLANSWRQASSILAFAARLTDLGVSPMELRRSLACPFDSASIRYVRRMHDQIEAGS
jgi:hypothetical protein